jgi:hypothetical protein
MSRAICVEESPTHFGELANAIKRRHFGAIQAAMNEVGCALSVVLCCVHSNRTLTSVRAQQAESNVKRESNASQDGTRATDGTTHVSIDSLYTPGGGGGGGARGSV